MPVAAKKGIVGTDDAFHGKYLPHVYTCPLDIFFFHIGLWIKATQHLTADPLDGTGGDDAFRRTSGSHHDIDIRPGISDHQGSSHISIGMELNARAGGADISDEFRVTRLVQNKKPQGR